MKAIKEDESEMTVASKTNVKVLILQKKKFNENISDGN